MTICFVWFFVFLPFRRDDFSESEQSTSSAERPNHRRALGFELDDFEAWTSSRCVRRMSLASSSASSRSAMVA